MSFECWLTPLFVDTAQALWASFCFRLRRNEWFIFQTYTWPVTTVGNGRSVDMETRQKRGHQNRNECHGYHTAYSLLYFIIRVCLHFTIHSFTTDPEYQDANWRQQRRYVLCSSFVNLPCAVDRTLKSSCKLTLLNILPTPTYWPGPNAKQKSSWNKNNNNNNNNSDIFAKREPLTWKQARCEVHNSKINYVDDEIPQAENSNNWLRNESTRYRKGATPFGYTGATRKVPSQTWEQGVWKVLKECRAPSGNKNEETED